jgi:hypothetical protein
VLVRGFIAAQWKEVPELLIMISNVDVVPDASAESGAGVLLPWGVGTAKPASAGVAAVAFPVPVQAAGMFGPALAGAWQDQSFGPQDLIATYAHKTRIAADSGELGLQPAREPV